MIDDPVIDLPSSLIIIDIEVINVADFQLD